MCFTEYALCKFRMTRPTQAELSNTAEYKALEASEAGPCLSLCRGLICSFNPWLKLEADPNTFSLMIRIFQVCTFLLCAMQFAVTVLLGLHWSEYADSRVWFMYFVFATTYGVIWIVYDHVCTPNGCIPRTCHLRNADHLMYYGFGFGIVNFVWLFVTIGIVDNGSAGMQYLKDHNPFASVVLFLTIASYLCSAVANLVIGSAALAFGEYRYFNYIHDTPKSAAATKGGRPVARDPENISHIVVRHG